jgi:trafficking protein particle complex subunit 9
MFRVQSGSWTNAIASLAEGASIAQNGQDHLWHAKALEYLLIDMLLLSWADMSFTVPQVCRSLPNRSGAFQAEVSPRSGDSIKVLAQLLPPMVETILELYAKVANLDLGGTLQDVLRESRVRLVNILIFVKRAGGVLTKQGLIQIVTGVESPPSKPADPKGEAVAISKAGLANILIDTLQDAQSSRSASHHTNLLVAVASSLSALGLDRKHAFYIKQLMQQFVPRLIEARKVGASEAGVHPAAGLPPLSAALQGIMPEMVVGTRTMLNLAAGAYGVPLRPVSQPSEIISADLQDLHSRLQTWTTEHDSGDAMLKVEMLRTCVGVCEALPDVAAGLHFSSSILRSSIRVATMPMYPVDCAPLISAEEQVHLLESMKRGVAAAARLSADGCRAEYWDDFLVRDIQVFERDNFSKLIAHKPSDLAIRGSALVDTVRDPFIYNPFSKAKSVTAAPVLVAGELSTFAVLLQNPLEVEIEIEQIGLLSQGCAFEASAHSIVMGPMSTQLFTLNGTPTESGDLEIIGCRATIRNCYEQDFLTFREEWKPSVVLKHRAGGKVRTKRAPAIEEAGDGVVQSLLVDFKPPATTALKLKVINAQPRLSVRSNSLKSPAIMLLEGESRTFELTLVNESQKVSADLVLVTAEDSVSDRLKEALSVQDLNPAEKYELQNQLALHPAVKIEDKRQNDSKSVLEAGATISYKVAVFGRPGLVNATVHADFAFLGSPSAEVEGTFYTRQVRFPVSITVNGSVEMPRCNILPIHGDFSWAGDGSDDKSTEQDGDLRVKPVAMTQVSRWLKGNSDASQYCMLSIDLRNVWPQPLTIELSARKPSPAPAEDYQWDDPYSIIETLQPGHVSRALLLVPRVFVQDPHAPIPNLETQKQFVVSTSKLTAEQEATSRESFWYREELLKSLRGTWRDETTGRHGDIDLRKGIRLSPRMVDALKKDHVQIDYALRPRRQAEDTGESLEPGTVWQIGRSHFAVQTESFATLFVTIRNHTQEALRLILRLQPALRHQPHNIALDLSRRFAWTGVLQRAVHPAIDPGAVFEAQLGILALVDGEYEINASVEEIAAHRKPERAGTGPERRIWHARAPCLVDATSG